MSTKHGGIERWSGFKVWLFWLLGRGAPRSTAAVDYLGLTEDDSFLDVGCGLGEALEHASSFTTKLAGVDPSPAMVERASRKVPTATIQVGSAESIPFPDAHFTAVLVLASFHHWADQPVGIAEVHRVLAPGGRVLIVEKQLERGKGHGLTRDEAGQLADTLTRSGFDGAVVGESTAGGTDFYTVLATTARGS